jgi:hypothetical protein
MSAPPGYPPFYAPPPPKKRRGLLIALIVVAVLIMLGGGGATATYFLTRNPDGKGQATAQGAVDNLLQAMYLDQNPTKAATLVCKAVRDPKKIGAKIDEIKRQGQQYDNPKYTWTSLTTEHSTPTQAVISTTVTLTTDDVQSATQKLRFTAIKSDGWFVCDVTAV